MLKNLLSKKNNSGNEFKLDVEKIPFHVAIIMDGNGRWAKNHGMPRSMGHRAGAETLKKIVSAADALSIKVLTVYGFSTENWKRPAEEVSLLMGLIKEYLLNNIREMHEKNVRIRFIGYIKGLSEELQHVIQEAEALTENNSGLVLQLAINYGGRDEIIRATRTVVKKAQSGEIAENEITDSLFSRYLYTGEYSEVDLLIRPSGDFRISNFLLWQLAYAEFWFTDKHWPEFTADTLKEAVYYFQQRERRFGGLLEE